MVSKIKTETASKSFAMTDNTALKVSAQMSVPLAANTTRSVATVSHVSTPSTSFSSMAPVFNLLTPAPTELSSWTVKKVTILVVILVFRSVFFAMDMIRRLVSVWHVLILVTFSSKMEFVCQPVGIV